jgi:hypothetical protein
MVLAVLLALLVGVFATIYVQYNYGGIQHGWLAMPGEYAFNMVNKNLAEFDTNWQQKVGLNLAKVRLNAKFLRFLYAAGIGLALVLLCGAMRLRYIWWPIHPILFLVWGTFPMKMLAASFLLGWVVKLALTKFGGSQTYRKAKPLFVGIVAGEFVAGILWMIISGVQRMTDRPYALFRVHP